MFFFSQTFAERFNIFKFVSNRVFEFFICLLTTSSSASPILINIDYYVPVKLGKNNFVVWKTLFEPVLRTFNLLGHIDGLMPCPEQFVRETPRSGPIVNPDYLQWIRNDQQVMIWINATISDDLLPYIVGFTTVFDLWQNLAKRFAVLSRSHIIQLKTKLQMSKKGSSSISEYLHNIKVVIDTLAATGNRVDDTDVRVYILNGFPHEYAPFVTSIRVRAELVTTDELHALLLSEKLALESVNASLQATAAENSRVSC